LWICVFALSPFFGSCHLVKKSGLSGRCFPFNGGTMSFYAGLVPKLTPFYLVAFLVLLLPPVPRERLPPQPVSAPQPPPLSVSGNVISRVLIPFFSPNCFVPPQFDSSWRLCPEAVCTDNYASPPTYHSRTSLARGLETFQFLFNGPLSITSTSISSASYKEML